jgi:PAS domain-containing protein
MKKEKRRVAPDGDLRRRAESVVKKKRPAAASPAADAELRRLVHELQVHQIELELQNEELVNARDEMSALLEKYTNLYDFAPVGFLTVDGSGAILEINLAASNLLGADRSHLLRQQLERYVAVADQVPLRALLARLPAVSGKEICEVELLSTGGEKRQVRIEGVTAEPGAGVVPAIFRLALLDISESHRLKMELLRHNCELQNALDHIRTLQGVIPICSYCHRIRNGQQVWEKLEAYISSHSDAEFSHGICADCLEKHFPEECKK